MFGRGFLGKVVRDVAKLLRSPAEKGSYPVPNQHETEFWEDSLSIVQCTT